MDRFTVKVRNLAPDITEDDLYVAFSKRFGGVNRVRIPMEELRNGRKRSKGFAFVSFFNSEDATKALKERELTVDMCVIEIEEAMERPRPPTENPIETQNR